MLKGELFNTDMVRALLDGRKVHTARPVKYRGWTPEQSGRDKFYESVEALNGKSFYGAGFYKDSDVFTADGQKHVDAEYFKAKFQPGDYMYVRETWCEDVFYTDILCERKSHYRATEPDYADKHKESLINWCPSIHMPRVAARLFYRVTRVEVMNLDNVGERFAREDGFLDDYEARAQGLEPENTLGDYMRAKMKFMDFWRRQYGSDARWMWVYWMEQVSKEESYAA